MTTKQWYEVFVETGRVDIETNTELTQSLKSFDTKEKALQHRQVLIDLGEYTPNKIHVDKWELDVDDTPYPVEEYI